MGLVNIGYGNIISEKRLVAIVSPDSAPVKRLISQTKESSKLIDGTCGRRTKSVLILDSGHIVLSAILPETIAQRLELNSGKQEEE